MQNIETGTVDSNPRIHRLRNGVHARWGTIRSLWHGLKVAKASVISVLFGLLLFYAVPQAQDLFLEVRGSALMGTIFWIAFYLAILVGWAIPVYVSSRWVLSRFPEGATASPEDGPVAIKDWVRRAIPPLLAALCFGAVLAGQIMSLSNAPTVVELSELEKRRSQLLAECPDDNIAKCGVIKYAASVAQFFAVLVAGWVGAERMIVVLYAICAALVAWVLLQRLARRIPVRAWRVATLVVWWIVTVLVVVPVTLLALAVLYGLIRHELEQSLNLGHLILLPLATVLVGWLVWWGLRPGPGEQPTRVARALLRIVGGESSADQTTATARLLGLIFFTMIGLTIAIVLLLLIVHPVHATSQIYRALLVPFLLGLLVPVFTYLTYWSARSRAPLVFLAIVLVAIFAARFADTHDVRTVRSLSIRPALEESVMRWAAANGCELKATDQPGRYTAPGCPPPIIVSAAGGASRAAFLVGSVLGKLLDEKSAAVLEGHEQRLSGVSFSPDGRRILTDSQDYALRLWMPLAAMKSPPSKATGTI